MSDAYKKFGLPEKVPSVVASWLDQHGDAFINVVVYNTSGMKLSDLIASQEELKNKVKELEEEKNNNQLFG